MDTVLKDLSPVIQLLVVMAMFSMLPFMFVCMTSFLRYAIVFGILKQALGAQQIPPAIVLVGLSMILTFYTMDLFFNKCMKSDLSHISSPDLWFLQYLKVQNH